jgi:exodeoxyribonuclease-5
MDKDLLLKKLLQRFPFEPTKDQKKVLTHLAAFNESKKVNPVYILKGYAGTGKTTTISTYVKELSSTKQKFVLMAPTGRAAKVLSHYTGFGAFTIHRLIYSVNTDTNGKTKISLNYNKNSNTVFIVDEASMIGENSGNESFQSGNLLDDLMSFVFSQTGNRMVLIGDTAQLPPVNLNISPALDIDYLKSAYTLTAYSFEMKEVMRQALDSGILITATSLRKKIEENNFTLPLVKKADFKNDVVIVEDSIEMQEFFQQYFYGDNMKSSIIVCRSNKRANLFNFQIRNRILQCEREIEAGDLLMVVKNNYYWLKQKSNPGFIANGDIAEVIRVLNIYENYGFKFAEAEIKLVDYPDAKSFVVMLFLDTLYIEKASFDNKEINKLYEKLKDEYSFLGSKTKIFAAIKNDYHYNALQVKFAYAMTCHKTQGGQWSYVFVDKGFVSDDMINKEYLRWLYTAFTRAYDKLFLLGFDGEFVENGFEKL